MTASIPALACPSNVALMADHVDETGLDHDPSNMATPRPAKDKPKQGIVIFPPKIMKALTLMATPNKSTVEALPIVENLKAIALASRLNVMLVLIPISWALRWALPPEHPKRDILVFVFSFLAIIPLVKLLGFATEELARRFGPTLAGLLNATLGNMVEFIIAVIALNKCEILIVQYSLLGSVLNNLLLVLGLCFLFGGLRYQEQGFSVDTSQLNSTLLTFSVVAVLLPVIFHLSANAQSDTPAEAHSILTMNRAISLVFLVVYIGYLARLFCPHPKLFKLWSSSAQHSDQTREFFELETLSENTQQMAPESSREDQPGAADDPTSQANTIPGANVDIDQQGEGANPTLDQVDEEATTVSSGNDGRRSAPLNIYFTLGLLAIVTALVAATAEWLIDSIGGLTDHAPFNREFIGIILLPMVSNTPEHAGEIVVAVKDRLNLSLGVAAGSSIQIALFVLPLVVTLGWIIGKPMTLLFDPYASIVLFFAVLLINYIVQDGKSNWLEGFLLILFYAILGVAFWFYPGASDPSGVLGTCR